MNFKEAIKKLDIEEYGERIFNSNSCGELFHLYDYILLAEVADQNDIPWFQNWFNYIVEYAKSNWNRPESVFQHIPKLLVESLGNYLEEAKKTWTLLNNKNFKKEIKMKQNDYVNFTNLLEKLSLNFKECDFTEEKINLFWERLKKYKINSVKNGIDYVIDKRIFSSCPTIGEITEGIVRANKAL